MNKTTPEERADLIPINNPSKITSFPHLQQVIASCASSKLDENNLIHAMMYAIEYRKDIQDVLCYVEGDIYFRNLECQGGNPWVQDSMRYTGLARWFEFHMGEITLNEVKEIVQLCVQYEIIPQKSKEEYEALEAMDSISDPGDYVKFGKW